MSSIDELAIIIVEALSNHPNINDIGRLFNNGEKAVLGIEYKDGQDYFIEVSE